MRSSLPEGRARCPRHPGTRAAAALAVGCVAGLLVGACGGEQIPIYGADPFARDPAPVGPLGGKVVTSNAGDDTLSVLDPATPGPAGRLPIGFNPVELEGPHHLAADPAGRFLFVNLSLSVREAASGPHGVHGGGDQPGFVLKVDSRTGREIDRVKVDPNPGDSVLSADGRTLYVTHYDEIKWRRGAEASNLVVVDTERMVVRQRRPLCPAAHGVRIARDGRTLYATCGPDQIAIVDLADPAAPVRLVGVPGGLPGDSTACQRCPYALAIAPDDTVWVSNLGPNGGAAGRGSVEVYDPGREGGSFDPARQLVMRGRPVFAAFRPSADGYEALVPEQAASGARDAVHRFVPGGSGVAPTLLASVAFTPEQCLNPHMMLVDADGARGQLICEGDRRAPGTFVWLNLVEGAVIAAVPAGVFPDGLVLVPPLAATP